MLASIAGLASLFVHVMIYVGVTFDEAKELFQEVTLLLVPGKRSVIGELSLCERPETMKPFPFLSTFHSYIVYSKCIFYFIYIARIT